MSIYTAKITASPSAYLDEDYLTRPKAGSVDAAIYRDGVETDMEVTLVINVNHGELSAWGTRDHWCSRTDLLYDWVEQEDMDMDDTIAAIVEAVRDAAA